jgi:RecB family exonuclease
LLVAEWLDFEATRIDFEVADTEVKRTVHLAGVNFDLRLDRLDRLNDGSLLVIDYKSGDVSPKAWELPRPDDVQLPLYAGFALDPGTTLNGLVFARVRPGEMGFAGRVSAAATTLFPDLKTTNSLIKKPFSEAELTIWRECIQQLARDFVAGRAEVDPREALKTCERCGLQTLCRIQEQAGHLDAEDDSDGPDNGEEAGDE